MRYQSTRGGAEELTFQDVLFTAYCSDMGMAMPSRIPTIDPVTLRKMSQMTFVEIVKHVTRLYISESEIQTSDLHEIIDGGVSRIDHPEIVTLAKLSGSLNILELFHGRTFAFKDIALGCLARFISFFLKRNKKHCTAIVATSGDTGSAAGESIRGIPEMDLIITYPKGRCSKLQELQMDTIIEDNVHVYRVDCLVDQFDNLLHDICKDADFVKKHNLVVVNSLNWTRVMVQISFFFFAYFKVCRKIGEDVEIVVPTGGMGNLTAGSIAREMGLPIKLVCSVNVNDGGARALTSGDMSSCESGVKDSWACALDTQMPYNIERVLFLFSGGNAKLVKEHMNNYEKDLKTSLPNDLLSKVQQVVRCHTLKTNAAIEETMRRCWQENQYLICPHTAVAVSYHYAMVDAKDVGLPRVCFATASPAKFEEAVLSAGLTPQSPEGLMALKNKPTRYAEISMHEDWISTLRKKIEEISERKM